MEESEKIKSTSSLTVNVVLKLSEKEARALNAVAAYSPEDFLKVYYEKLGKSGLEPHADGIRTLFQTIRTELPKHLKKADDARDIWREAAKN